jgi:hypothetical protein
MKLAILSNVIHYRHEGRLYAYAAYAREIEMWADLFDEVRIAAPCREEPPAELAAPFARRNNTIVPQLEAGGDSVRGKAGLVLALPISERDNQVFLKKTLLAPRICNSTGMTEL